MHKLLLVAATLAAAAPAAFGDDAATIAATPAVVVISNYEFTPAVLTVAAGTTVTWVNEDQSPHTIAEQAKAFRSACGSSGSCSSRCSSRCGRSRA